jgi:hypothetical protein
MLKEGLRIDTGWFSCGLERIIRSMIQRKRAIFQMSRGLIISEPWLLINYCSLSIGKNLILTVTAVLIDYATRVLVLLGGTSVVRGAFPRLVESNNEAPHIG